MKFSFIGIEIAVAGLENTNWFEEWVFNKLELIAAVTNKASNQVAQKCDFQLIGRLPDEIFHQDVLKDANLWCLTKADYHKLHVL